MEALYSPSMNTILAEKMDQLEKWGVLVESERVGVQVEFVSPSMLVPKPEGGEYRLITDFSALNVYLKRVPNTLPKPDRALLKLNMLFI